jgi:hypothetical protein
MDKSVPPFFYEEWKRVLTYNPLAVDIACLPSRATAGGGCARVGAGLAARVGIGGRRGQGKEGGGGDGEDLHLGGLGVDVFEFKVLKRVVWGGCS